MSGFARSISGFVNKLSIPRLIQIFLFLFLLISVPLTVLSIKQTRDSRSLAATSYVTVIVFPDKNGNGLMEGSNENFGGGNPSFPSSVVSVTLNGTPVSLDQYGGASLTVQPGNQTVQITPNSPWFVTKWSYTDRAGVYGPYGYPATYYNLPPYNASTGAGSIAFHLGINKPTCTNQCSSGQSQCSGSGYQTCIYNSSDGCYEWSSSVTPCQYGCSGAGYCNNPPKPTISTFSANPSSITSGQSSTLSWSCTPNDGTVSVTITASNGQNIGTVTCTGSKTVTPSSSVSYTAVATGPGGTSNAASTSITVNNQPPPPTPPPSTPGGGGSSGGKKTSGGSSGTGSGILEGLQLNVSVPYLVGKVKLKADVGGASKEFEVSGSDKSATLDLKDSKLSLNKEYALVLTSGKTLVRKVKFTPTAASTTVNAGDLILGDVNQDNKVDAKDQTALMNSIAAQTTLGDLNADSAINSIDWAILLTNFGKTGD